MVPNYSTNSNGPMYTSSPNLSSVYNNYVSSTNAYEQQLVQTIQNLTMAIDLLQSEVSSLKQQVSEMSDLLVQHQVNRIEDELKGSQERA